MERRGRGVLAFGGEGSTGTYLMTALGTAVVLAALIGFVWLEKRKLERRAAMLRTAGTLDRTAVVVTTVTSD